MKNFFIFHSLKTFSFNYEYQQQTTVVLALLLPLSPAGSTGILRSHYSTCRSLAIASMLTTTSKVGYLLVLPLDLGFCFTKLKISYDNILM